MNIGKSAAANGGILAQYDGARPAAPDWFTDVLAIKPERSFFDVNGCDIELLTWGQVGKPGLLFLHGDSAHAEWWSFIAPFFAKDWRCAAISWSGMGRSGHKDNDYPFDEWSSEALAAIDAGQLDAGDGVMLAAHSLGGYPAIGASARSKRIKGIITLDTAMIPKELLTNVPRPQPRPHRLYTSAAEALARYRLMPPTDLGEHYIIDHIARSGLMEVQGDGEPGHKWRFDPNIWGNMDYRQEMIVSPFEAQCPLALLVGEKSSLIDAEVAAYMRGLFPENTPFLSIPEAGHHIMIDQPLALVAALRVMLSRWPDAGQKW